MGKLINNRVLLVNPPQDLKEVMGEASTFVSRWEPLGLLYIASVLMRNGFDVQVIDAEADPHTVDELFEIVQSYDPAVVGITCLTPTAPPSVDLGQRVRSADPERVVVMGNVHADIFAETLLLLGACEYIVHGDGEFVFLELLQCLQAGANPSGIAGISFLDQHRYVKNAPPPLPKDLDVIPPPARHLVKHLNYDAGMLNNLTFIRPKGTVSLHALGSRGCIFSCKFCVVHQERTFRSHSAPRIVDEVLDLQNNYHCGYLFFIDPIFVGNKKRVHAICDEMEKRGVTIPWGCEGHVRMVDRELLTHMKKAGCVQIAYGLESGSQRMLKHIGKGTKLEHIHQAIQLTRDVGIPPTGLFILGLPDETRDEMSQTIDLATKLKLDFAQFSMFVPYPGSEDFTTLTAAREIDTGVRSDGTVDFDVWRRYSPYVGYGEMGDSIYLPPDMDFDELFAMQRRAMRRFYFRPRQILSNMKRIRPGNILDIGRAARTIFFKQTKRGNTKPGRMSQPKSNMAIPAVASTPSPAPAPVLVPLNVAASSSTLSEPVGVA